jgi:hypothetical protein
LKKKTAKRLTLTKETLAFLPHAVGGVSNKATCLSYTCQGCPVTTTAGSNMGDCNTQGPRCSFTC